MRTNSRGGIPDSWDRDFAESGGGGVSGHLTDVSTSRIEFTIKYAGGGGFRVNHLQFLGFIREIVPQGRTHQQDKNQVQERDERGPRGEAQDVKARVDQEQPED